jgi:hemoglobin
MPSLYEHAGGEEAIHRLEDVFYGKILTDPVLKSLFGEGRPTHVDRLTAFTAESFGGPDRFSRELGFGHLISVHRHLKITEEQRQRFVELYMEALEEASLPDDEPFREAVRSHVEFGSRVAMQNSHAESDDELHPLREVPRWSWQGAR